MENGYLHKVTSPQSVGMAWVFVGKYCPLSILVHFHDPCLVIHVNKHMNNEIRDAWTSYFVNLYMLGWEMMG